MQQCSLTRPKEEPCSGARGPALRCTHTRARCALVAHVTAAQVDENGFIVDSKFKTFGCGSAIASSSVATEWVKGKTLEEVTQIKNSDIAKHLSLPPVKLHCSMLAEDAIKVRGRIRRGGKGKAQARRTQRGGGSQEGRAHVVVLGSRSAGQRSPGRTPSVSRFRLLRARAHRRPSRTSRRSASKRRRRTSEEDPAGLPFASRASPAAAARQQSTCRRRRRPPSKPAAGAAGRRAATLRHRHGARGERAPRLLWLLQKVCRMPLPLVLSPSSLALPRPTVPAATCAAFLLHR